MGVCRQIKNYSRHHEWVGNLFSLIAVALIFATVWATLEYYLAVASWLSGNPVLHGARKAKVGGKGKKGKRGGRKGRMGATPPPHHATKRGRGGTHGRCPPFMPQREGQGRMGTVPCCNQLWK